MRAYVALKDAHESVCTAVCLDAGNLVWAVSDENMAGLKPDDAEERESEALEECVLVAATSAPPHTRIVVAALDIASADTAAYPGSDRGEHARELTRPASHLPVKAFLVSHDVAAEVIEDKFAPEVLWFDPSEAESVRAFCAGE